MKSCFGSQRRRCAAFAAELSLSSDHGGWSHTAVVQSSQKLFLLELDNESLTQHVSLEINVHAPRLQGFT